MVSEHGFNEQVRRSFAFAQMRDIRARYDDAIDLRTAAFINAIDKIAVCYQDLGIFP